jgi:hypothetical protein
MKPVPSSSGAPFLKRGPPAAVSAAEAAALVEVRNATGLGNASARLAALSGKAKAPPRQASRMTTMRSAGEAAMSLQSAVEERRPVVFTGLAAPAIFRA